MTVKTPHILERYRTEIDAELRSVLASRQSPMYDMMRYHLGWIDEHGNDLDMSSGKALRPTLCLMACEAAGGDYHVALPVAAALELLHNFSLIHDDIQDNDRERRHRPTVWTVWGQPQAINAGTAMRMLCNVALSRLEKSGINAKKRLRIQTLLDEATLDLIEGQYLDISFEHRTDITVPDYMQMIQGKTAALIACSLETGALLGTDDETLTSDYRMLGLNLGFGFQIQDDILGIWGDSDVTGKPHAGDIRRRKKTLPVIRVLEQAGTTHKDFLERFFCDDHDERPVADMLSLLDYVDARSYAQEMAHHYCQKSCDLIDELLPESRIKQDFMELVEFLGQRSY